MSPEALTLQDIEKLINEYFLESEKPLDESQIRRAGEYPNTIILTKEHYIELIKELLKIANYVEPEIILEVKITSILGLSVMITDYIDYPRVLRIKKQSH